MERGLLKSEILSPEEIQFDVTNIEMKQELTLKILYIDLNYCHWFGTSNLTVLMCSQTCWSGFQSDALRALSRRNFA